MHVHSVVRWRSAFAALQMNSILFPSAERLSATFFQVAQIIWRQAESEAFGQKKEHLCYKKTNHFAHAPPPTHFTLKLFFEGKALSSS